MIRKVGLPTDFLWEHHFFEMGLPGFEPGSSGPKPESIAKLTHSPRVRVMDLEVIYKVIVGLRGWSGVNVRGT